MHLLLTPVTLQTHMQERAGYLMRFHDSMMEHAEDLAQLATAECGKPIVEARGEVCAGAVAA